jgi:hypothetical protein
METMSERIAALAALYTLLSAESEDSADLFYGGFLVGAILGTSNPKEASETVEALYRRYCEVTGKTIEDVRHFWTTYTETLTMVSQAMRDQAASRASEPAPATEENDGQFTVPTIEVGHAHTVPGPSGTLTINRLEEKTYHLSVTNQAHQRWASNRDEVEEDTVHFRQTGRLPNAPGGHW